MDLAEVKKKHEKKLLQKKYVVSVGIGKKEVGGMETDEDAVIVGVEKKVPEDELDNDQIIPKELENGIKTDCQEVGIITAPPTADEEESTMDKIKDFFSGLTGKEEKSRKDKWRPFPMGVSCGLHGDEEEEEVTAGTSGWILVDDNGNEYPSSNNHVYAAVNKGEEGDGAVQPGIYDGGDLPGAKNGELAGYVKVEDGVKVDVAWINATVGYKNELLGIGAPNADIHKVEKGDELVKSGRTTGVTRGTVKQAHADVKVGYPGLGVVMLKDQIITGKMLEGGDSGDASAWIDGSKIHPAAVGFAGSDKISVFNRIENVIEATGMKVLIEKEESEKPTADVKLVLEKRTEERGNIEVTTVTKADGNPIEGASVAIDGPVSDSGTTSGEGKVSFSDVPIGDYQVSAVKKGYKSDRKNISKDDFK